MAGYTPRNSGSNSNVTHGTAQAASKPVQKEAGKSDALFSTGLFAPSNSDSKAIATIKLKEAVTLPAGSYINLYESDKKSDKSPLFKMQVRAGIVKA